MVLELVGSRLMAPYLGTSLFVWTSLIGVILGCLALGYWYGGILADKRPEPKILAALLFTSGLLVALVGLAGDPLLFLVQNTFSDVRIGAVAATTVLFGIPAVLLGMVSPYAVRLRLSAVQKSGAEVGSLYALSTLGSIAGTFLAGFFLLSYFSHRAILFGLGATLILLAFAASGGGSKAKHLAALAALLAASCVPPFTQLVMGKDLVDTHTAYNRVWIYDAFMEGRRVRVMQLNDTSDSAMFMPDDELALQYTKYFRLAGHFRPGIRRALMVGAGAYSYPKFFLREAPDAVLETVEIDPGLTVLAKKHFGLQDDPRLEVFHEDARTFLQRPGSRYEAIFVDVYKSHSIPFQLTTREAMRAFRGRLADDGVFVMNVVSGIEGKNGRLLRALLATMDEFFPQIHVYTMPGEKDAQDWQNLAVVAFPSKEKRRMAGENADINRYLSNIWTKDIPRDMPALTDGFAPVERYMAGWIVGDSEHQSGILKKKMDSRKA